mmetsp:Transcript_19665/g.40048  ORF Transcript_19665/g.40048 Transcript_19665/m.40048 type:complete len:149 (-) Transcript_19665:824-1270(-)
MRQYVCKGLRSAASHVVACEIQVSETGAMEKVCCKFFDARGIDVVLCDVEMFETLQLRHDNSKSACSNLMHPATSDVEVLEREAGRELFEIGCGLGWSDKTPREVEVDDIWPALCHSCGQSVESSCTNLTVAQFETAQIAASLQGLGK